MDWKAQIASSIEAAVQASIEAALQRSKYASVEESADETARRRASWFGEVGRRRIELAEDRARRDPVWAEKMARRHAAFRDALPSTAARASGTTATAWAASAHLEPNLSTSMPGTAASTSTAPTSACAVCDGNLAARPPTTCSTNCPGCAAPPEVSTLVLAATSTTPTGSVAIVPEIVACIISDKGTDDRHMAMPMTSPVSITKLAAGPDLIIAPPTVSSAVCHELVPDAPVVVLMQAVLDITDSDGSGTLSMLLPLRKLEDSDTAGTHEDEQQLVGSCVDQTLAFVVANDAADDHSFVAGTSAVPRTLAALGVNEDDLIVNKHEVMGTCDSSVNQLHAECNAMCSGLGCTTLYPNSLLPWDPREKTGVSTDYVLSRDIALDACVQQSDADLSGSHDHQKSGYAKTWNYFHGSIQVFCSSWNAVGKCSRESIQVEVLKNQFDCAGPFSKQYLEFCATTHLLLRSFSIVQKNCQPQYLEVSESCYCCEPMFEGTKHHGVEYFPWEIAWLLLGYSRDCLEQEGRGNLTGKCRQYGEVKPRPIPWPSFEHDQAWVVCYIGEIWVSRFGGLTYVDDTGYVHSCELIYGCHQEMLWDPGGFNFSAWNCQWWMVLVNCKSRLRVVHSTLKWPPLQVNCYFARMLFMLCGRAQMNDEFNCGTSLDLVVYCGHPALTLAYTSSWRLMFAGYLLQYGPDAGVLLLLSSEHPITIHCAVQGYTGSSTFLAILNERGKVQHRYICMSVVIEAIQLLNQHSSSNHAIVWRNRTPLFDHRATITIVWSNQLLKLKRSSEEAKGRRNAAASAYYRGHCLDHAYYFDEACADHDYYLDVIPDQADIGHNYYIGVFLEQVRAVDYINVVKVHLDYSIQRDLGEVIKHQVPWDPGGSTRHRLEVKPKIKEGGMLATLLPGIWAASVGLQPARKPDEEGTDVYQWNAYVNTWLGTGRLRPPSLLSSVLPPLLFFFL